MRGFRDAPDGGGIVGVVKADCRFGYGRRVTGRRELLLAGAVASVAVAVFPQAGLAVAPGLPISIPLPKAGKGKIAMIVVTGGTPKPGFSGSSMRASIANLSKLPPDIRAAAAVSKPITKGPPAVYRPAAVPSLTALR